MSNVSSRDELSAKVIGASQTAANSPLINYALAGLQKLWLPELDRWSHIYHLDGRENPKDSFSHHDVVQTLHVLLGMSRIRAVPRTIDVPYVFRVNAEQLTRLPVPKHTIGLAVWAAARLKLDLPFGLSKMIRHLLEDRENWTRLRGQDIGLLLTGIVAQAVGGRTEFIHHAAPLANYLSESFATETGLFCDSATGYRRRFATFTTQVYLAIACYSYGEYAGDLEMIHLGNACARRLIELQGPQGEWPRLFDAECGKVVDFYDVQSVHQFGMAPALLEFAERHNVEGASQALVHGFIWIFGENQLRRCMLMPSLHMSYSAHVRQRDMRGRILRIVSACIGRNARLVAPAQLVLRKECRSLDLGWILWSFGERRDLPQITHNLFFSSALR
jgi:hypothetical protein